MTVLPIPQAMKCEPWNLLEQIIELIEKAPPMLKTLLYPTPRILLHILLVECVPKRPTGPKTWTVARNRKPV